MKKAILFLLLIATISVKAQTFSGQPNTPTIDSFTTTVLLEVPEYYSKYDTVVLYKGDEKAVLHNWAYKPIEDNVSHCLVLHGPLGCENDLKIIFRICITCLRHEQMKETRFLKDNLYGVTLEKLLSENKIQKTK